MAWNFDEVPEREGTSCIKYDLREDTFGNGKVIPMWVADMDFSTPGFITESIRKRLEHDIFGYSFRPPEYFTSIAGWFAERHKWKINTDWIVFCPGIVPALNLCTLSFTRPGDRIIVQPPVYFPFFSAVEAHGRELVINRLAERDGRWEMDFESLAAQIDDRTTMIIISNPHNPVGRAWTHEELEKLAGICNEKNIIILSDEIHCDLILPGYSHTPLASVSEETAARTVTCIAPSKTFNLAGLSTSSLIITDNGLRKSFCHTIDKLHIGNGNIFGTVASVSAYSSGGQWLDELMAYIDGNARLVTDYCTQQIPEIKPVKPEATYMIWLDCRNLGMSGAELQNFFVSKAGVGMSEGSLFGPGGEGFMRMNVATPRGTVRKAMEQIEKAVKALR